MSPYIVTLGEVHDGSTVYVVGDVLPDGVADAAIVAGGTVAPVQPELPAKPQPKRKAVK